MYDAFISYSHKKDRPIAAALQTVLQTLGKAWWQRRKLRIFRDETSLSATPELWPSIERRLLASRFLILLASPEAAQSHWVNKELATWLSRPVKDDEPRVPLIALTDGDLEWDAARSDFSWTSTTPLPPTLKARFTTEPLWIDLREYRSGADRASRRNHDFATRAGKLAASVLGIPLEDLLSEELRQQRRALALAFGAVAGLVVLFAIAAGATIQRQAALTEARNNLASSLLGQAALATSEKEGHKALVYLAEAERVSQAGSWPTRSILTGAPVSTRVAIFDIGAPLSQLHFDASQNRMGVATGSSVRLVDLGRTSPDINLQTGGEGVADFAFIAASNSVVARGPLRLFQWTLDDPSRGAVTRFKLPSEAIGLEWSFSVSEDQSTIFFPAYRIYQIDARSFAVNDEPKWGYGWISAIAVHPSGRFVAATSGMTNVVSLLGTDGAGKINKSLPNPDSRALFDRHLAFSPDGRFLATVAGRGLIRIWRITVRGDEIEGLVHFDAGLSEARVLNIAVSPDSKLVAASYEDFSVAIWDIEAKRLISRLTGHRGKVRALAFTPDSRYIASGSDDGTVQIWSLFAEHDTGLRMNLGYGSGVSRHCAIAFSGDGSRLAIGGAKGSPYMHATELFGPDARRKLLVGEMMGRPVYGIANLEGVTPPRIYDFAQSLMAELQLSQGNPWLDRVIPECLQFSHDDRYLLGMAPRNRSLLVWDAETGDLVAQHAFAQHAPRTFVADPRSQRLAVEFEDGSVEIAELDRVQYRPLANLKPDRQGGNPGQDMEWSSSDSPVRMVFSANGELLLIERTRKSTLWNIKTATEHTLTAGAGKSEHVVGYVGDLRFLAFEVQDDPDHGHIVLRSTAERDDYKAVFPNWTTGRGYGRGLASSGGRYLALSAADGSITIWDSRTRRPGRSLVRDVGRLEPMCFDSSGTILVAQVYRNSDDVRGHQPSGEIEFWDVETGQRIGQVSSEKLSGFIPDRAVLSTGQPHLALWNDRSVFVLSGAVSDQLKTAAEASGYGLKAGSLRRLPREAPSEAELAIRPIKIDKDVASLWRAVWKVQRDLAAGTDHKVAGAPIREWLARNTGHPYRAKVPEIVESLLEPAL